MIEVPPNPETVELSVPALPVVAAAAVPAVVLVVIAVVVLLEAAGRHPYSEMPPQTMAEAVLRGDVATAARFIGLGADPNSPSAVHVPDLGPADVSMTPIEAAARGGSDDMLLFLEPSITLSPDARRDLVCLARAERHANAADLLARPLGGAVSCDGWADPRKHTR